MGGNPEVRQAMAMAVDQQSLIQVARRGFAGVRCQDHPSLQVPGYTANLTCPKFDLAAANSLLQSKGWVMGSDGVRAKNGERLEFQYSTTANNLWRCRRPVDQPGQLQEDWHQARHPELPRQYVLRLAPARRGTR